MQNFVRVFEWISAILILENLKKPPVLGLFSSENLSSPWFRKLAKIFKKLAQNKHKLRRSVFVQFLSQT